MAGPYSKILKTCNAINLQGPVKGSRQHPYLSLPLQVPLDLYTAQVAEQLAQQPGLLQNLLLFWAPVKTSSILGHLVNGPE